MGATPETRGNSCPRSKRSSPPREERRAAFQREPAAKKMTITLRKQFEALLTPEQRAKYQDMAVRECAGTRWTTTLCCGESAQRCATRRAAANPERLLAGLPGAKSQTGREEARGLDARPGEEFRLQIEESEGHLGEQAAEGVSPGLSKTGDRSFTPMDGTLTLAGSQERTRRPP